MEAASGTLDTKVQRTQLKLEGALNKIADLERANDEFKRSNTDLSNQLERWANLETKGGEAKEKEHKKRIALELELNEIKEQFEQQAEELDKAKRKVEKIKDVAANYEVGLSVAFTPHHPADFCHTVGGQRAGDARRGYGPAARQAPETGRQAEE